MALYRASQDAPPLDLANAIRSLAVLTGQSGQTDRALPLWTEARNIYEEAGVQGGVNECSARIARLSAIR